MTSQQLRYRLDAATAIIVDCERLMEDPHATADSWDAVALRNRAQRLHGYASPEHFGRRSVMTAFASPTRWRATPSVAREFRDRPRRLPNEFYPTPPEATRALLSVERFDGDIWEPACGDGRIAKVLSDHGHAVVSTDLHAYGHGISGTDFLLEREPRAKHIVTNPPYGSGLADRFLRRTLHLTRETGGKVAMLLNMASLCHPGRTGEWREAPPARIYAIDDIVCWPEDRYGPAPKYFTKHRYVWAVWTPQHNGPPAFWWLSGAEFRAPNFNSSFNDSKHRRFS